MSDLKKPVGLWVRMLRSHTSARVPAGYILSPIKKSMGIDISPYPYPNKVKILPGFGYRIPIAISRCVSEVSLFYHFSVKNYTINNLSSGKYEILLKP
jgi:hypothetical protein